MSIDLDHVPSASDVPQSEIAAAIQNCHRAVDARVAADHALAQLERTGRAAAERKDAEATAAALSAGNADPGPRAVSKFARVDRRAQDRPGERADRGAPAPAAVANHGAELVRTVLERFEKSRGEYVAALGGAEALQAQLVRLRCQIVLSLVLLASVVVGWPVSARADGDPASDVLASQSAFVSADSGASIGEQARLARVLSAAARLGYPIRVALIASASDLGSVTALWRQPQNYAHFLWQELSFAVHARVLVVMPGGLGLYDGRGPTVGELAVLARSRGDAREGGLMSVAATAVEGLAAAAGHPLPATIAAPTKRTRSGPGETDTVSWIVFAIGAALITAAWAASLRARPLHGRERGASSA